MATNHENTPVTDLWEQIVTRGLSTSEIILCDQLGNTLGKLLSETEPFTDNEDGSFSLNYADGTQSIFRANEITDVTFDDATGVVTVTHSNKENDTFTIPIIESGSVSEGTLTLTTQTGTDIEVTGDITGPMGFRGFQGAYPVEVYRVGTVTSDYTGDLSSTFDTSAIFSQDNGTPTDWLANRSGVLADGEIYWVRQAIIDPSLVDTDGNLTLTWGTPYQEESGAGGATAGVIEYTSGSGGTIEIAQWIGTIAQYNALTDGIKNSEILFTVTNDQTEVAEDTGGSYGDSDVLAYLNANTYVGGITVAASQINLLDGKVDADLTNTQLSETDIANFGFTKDTNTNLTKTDITNFGFVADSTTLAGYGITDAATSTQGGKADTALQNLNGALLETTPATDTTELVTVIDTSGTVTQGTLPVANLVQQEGTSLGVGRAAAVGNIELQNTAG